jgi:hypothetical protein
MTLVALVNFLLAFQKHLIKTIWLLADTYDEKGAGSKSDKLQFIKFYK